MTEKLLMESQHYGLQKLQAVVTGETVFAITSEEAAAISTPECADLVAQIGWEG